jgi:hypothetical protein
MNRIAPHQTTTLDDLSPIERMRRIKVKHAAAIAGMSPAAFRQNYAHLIERHGQRLDLVRLEDALTLPRAARPQPQS